MVHRGNKKEVEEVEGQRDGNNRNRNRIRDRKNPRVVGRESQMDQKKWKVQDENGTDVPAERVGVRRREIKMRNEGFCTP